MREKSDDIKAPTDKRPLRKLLIAFILISLIIYVLLSFRNFTDSDDDKYVMDRNWKYGTGYNSGDWLSFDDSKNYRVQNNILYKRDSAVARIISIDKAIFRDSELKIESLKTGESGTYHEK